MCPKCFLKIIGNPNNYQFYLPNFLKFCDNISHKLLRPSKFLEKFMEILEWPTLQKKIRSLPLLSVAAYWKSSNAEACAKKLSQIHANKIKNEGKGVGLKIYMRYCSSKSENYLNYVVYLFQADNLDSIFFQFHSCIFIVNFKQTKQTSTTHNQTSTTAASALNSLPEKNWSNSHMAAVTIEITYTWRTMFKLVLSK